MFGELPSRRCAVESLESRCFLAADSELLFPNQFAEMADAPSARFEGYNVVVGERMYAMGGFNGQFRTVPNIDIYNSQTGRWSTIEGRIPVAETHAGHAPDGSSIYFAGGYFGNLGANREQRISKEVWRYDTHTDTWEQLPSLPNGRGGGVLVRAGRTLHYFGGCLADRVTNTGAHWMLQLGRSSGGADDGATWTRRPAMPSPRDHFSAVEAGGIIYVFGGEYGHDVEHSQSKLVHSFNPKTGDWSRLADMPVAKSHMESATFAWGNKIIVAGGQVDDYASTSDVQQYDIEADSWTAVKSLPFPRQGGAVLKIGESLIVALGGRETYQPLDDVWRGAFR